MDMFERTVNATVLSGIAPLELQYVGVFDGYSECPVAYRAHTVLFTTETGVLDDLADFADQEVGIRLTLRNVAHAIRSMQALLDAGRTTGWISVEASASLLLSDDVYATLEAVLTAEHCECAERICLEFPPYVMGLDRAKVRRGFADIKALGLLISLAPITAEFALAGLMDVPVDQVVLSPDLTALASDRNKAGVLAATIALLNTMGVSVVALGAVDDDQIRELTTVECFGFVPTTDYTGEFLLPLGARAFKDIQADEEGI